MASLFVDTNVFLRFLTNDDPVKAKHADRLFRDAVSGKIALTTSLLVIAEIIWTLESFYKLEKDEIASKVESILNTPNLECAEASLIFMALDLYVHHNIDFIDAYHAALGRAGIFAEPAGAASYAGLVKAVRMGSIGPDDPVLVINTGNGLKDVKAAMRAAGEAPIIEPTLDAVKRILK